MNGLLNYFDLLGYRMLKTEDDMYHKALIITDRVYKSKDEYIDKLYSNCDMMNSVTEKIVFFTKRYNYRDKYFSRGITWCRFFWWYSKHDKDTYTRKGWNKKDVYWKNYK